MTDGDLDLLETLDREATPGPWVAKRTDPPCGYVRARGDEWGHAYEYDLVALLPTKDANPYNQWPAVISSSGNDADGVDMRDEDRALIAAMRNALPALIADSRALAAYRTREQQARALVAQTRRDADAARSIAADSLPPSAALYSAADSLEAIYAKEPES